MKKYFVLYFLIISLLFSGFSFADHRDFLFEQGNQAYQKGEYENAIKSYEEIVQTGFENADLYYNLGNSYFKLGQNPKAILSYERALRLRPNDEDIQFNLQIANLAVVDKIPQIPELFYIKYFKQFQSLFSIQTLTIFSLSMYFLFFCSLILWLLIRSRKLRITFRSLSFVLIILLILISFTFISKILYHQRNVEAIVMAPQVNVLSAPSEDGTEIFTIHEGLKVKIVNTSGNWNEIRLPDGNAGWLLTTEIEKI